MAAGPISTVDRRVRFPVVAAVLASTFIIGAVVGATALAVAVSGTHGSSGTTSYAVLPAGRTDMSAAAYAALHPAADVTIASGTDMSTAAYAALHPASGGDMSAAAYAALHPVPTAR